MKILITGASGNLGISFLRLVKNRTCFYALDYNAHPSFKNYKNYFKTDITNYYNVKKIIQRIKPDLVLHLAALTDLDMCEKNKKLASRVNISSTANIAALCSTRKIKLVFISTDNVFDGNSGNYTEFSKTNPINYYGKTKAIAESEVRKLKNHLIIRTTFFHWGEGFTAWLIDSLRMKKSVNIVDDQYCSPLFLDDLSRILIRMIDRDFAGTYNVALDRKISRYEFALILAKYFSFNRSLIRNVKTEELYRTITQKSYKIPRDVSLNVSRLKKAGIRIPSLDTCIKHFKETEGIYRKSPRIILS